MVRKRTKTELELAEIKYQSLIEKRDQYNAEANVFKEERDTLHKQKRELNEEMKSLKAQRDSLVKEMRSHKNLRNEYQKKAKELIDLKRKRKIKVSSSLPSQIESLKREVRDLDRKQQTTSLTLEEENALLEDLKRKMKEIKELEIVHEEQKKIVSEVEEIDRTIDDLFRKAEEEHSLVLKLSKEAQELHEKIVEKIKSISYLIAEANKKHSEYMKLKEKADHYHMRAVGMRSKIISIKKDKWEERKLARKMIEEQNIAVRKALQDKEKLEKVAEEALEVLIKKGKLELRG